MAASKKRKDRRKRVLIFLVKLSISVSLIAYLLTLFDFNLLKNELANLSLTFICIAVMLLFGQSLLSALKWRTLLIADGIQLGYFFLLKTYLISNFMSLFLPTSFGGDVYRVLAVRKAANSTSKTASSVLFDRLTGLFALLSIASVAFLLYPGLPFKHIVALLFMCGIGLFWLGSSSWIVDRLSSTNGSLLQKASEIFRSFHTYARNSRCLVIALIVSFTFQLNVILINKMYSLALNLDVPITQLLLIIPLIYLTEAIPISINGLGVRESAFVFFYQQIGQTAEAGFAAALLVLTMRYGIGLLGGGLLLHSVVSKDRSAVP